MTSCASSSRATTSLDDVTIQVLTQCRDHLIERTFDAIRGSKQAIVHFYNSTSVLQRRVVFGLDQDGIVDIALQGARLCRKLEETIPETTVYYEYSPESYTGTELDFAARICNAVIDVIDPTPDHKMIVNLPATVEMATPNVYADSIEWMVRHLDRRESIVVSLHPHNDRGTAWRQPSWATWPGRPHRGLPVRQRRAHWQRRPRDPGHEPLQPGHRPRDRLLQHRRGPPHGRALQPAAGGGAPLGWRPRLHGLLRIAPGRDQEGLRGHGATGEDDRKGHRRAGVGRSPTCPSTRTTSAAPTRRSCASTASRARAASPTSSRASTTSTCPAASRSSSAASQGKTDAEGGEVTPRQLWSIFKDEYLPAKDGETNDWGRFTPVAHTLVSGENGTDRITATMLDRGVEVTVDGMGNGPIAAFIDALSTLDIDVRVLDYHEHALSAGGDAKAAAYVECAVGDRVLWGVGPHSSIVKACSRRSSPQSTGRSATPPEGECRGHPAGPPGARPRAVEPVARVKAMTAAARDVFVLDAVRTPFGRFGGSLAGVRPDDLAALVLRELVARHRRSTRRRSTRWCSATPTARVRRTATSPAWQPCSPACRPPCPGRP